MKALQMRNKKAIFFIFSVFSLFFLFNNSARAQEKNNFSFSAYTGIESSKTTESLFYKPGDELLTGSRLDWKSPFLPCIGATCQVNLFKYLSLAFDSTFALPQFKNIINPGKIEDFDWMNIYSTGEKNLTHYSQSTNQVNSLITMDFNLGHKWPISEKLSITNYATFNFEWFKFSSMDGYYQYAVKTGSKNGHDIYGTWSADLEKKNSEGKKIEYKGLFLFLGLGTQIGINITEKISMSFSESIAFTTISSQIDFHIKRNLYTGFTNQHLWKNSTKLNLNCSLNRNSSIGFGANLGYIFGQPCEVYSKNIKSDSSEWEKLDNLGGFNQLLFSFSICYNFILSK